MRASPKPERTHVSDEDLVLLANGELSTEQSATVGRHLEDCDQCGIRLGEIQDALKDYVEARRTELDPRLPPSYFPRLELKRALANARTASGWRIERLTLRPETLWAVGLTTLLIAAATVTLRSRGPGNSPDTATTDSRFVPDSRLTPGLATPVSAAEICAEPQDARSASTDRALAARVFRLHGVVDPQPGAYEIDHLIPPELGGASDIQNLWPQPYGIHPWNAYAKDALEDHLLRAVCAGTTPLAAAQRDLANDWIAAYRKHFRTGAPLAEHASFLKDEPWE